jgi:hypothetical protein
MFKCLNQQTMDEVVILAPAWRVRLAELRSLDHAGSLICPGCRQPVRIRAGKFRRWHFAHKHLANCPLANQSPELLHCRAALYEWLLQHFDPQAINLEKHLPGLARPLDIWVQAGEAEFGYWIFDTRVSPQVREELRQCLEGQGMVVNWIFTSKLLHEDSPHPGRLHLTTTEREFLRTSSLDAAAEAAGETPGLSITYLDADSATFITYRSLKLRHPPQLFSGRRFSQDAASVKPHPASGECLYLEDPENLWRYQQKASLMRQRTQKQREFFAARTTSREIPQPGMSPEKDSIPGDPRQSIHPPDLPPVRQPFARAGVCKICGKSTTDWVTYFSKTGECICRDCQG